jgi:WD40 repeat protein/class 3 adenylate cyclase/tRNA A-37 threonylcarbamoyl transferase component Bud32
LVTLVFTDLVESTALKRSLGDQAGAALIQQHRALVRELLRQFPGSDEIETAGDSFLLVFSKPSAAVTFALLLQHRQRQLGEKSGHPVPIRVGVHLGEVVIEEHETGRKAKDLYGIQLDTCARVMSLAKADQVLLSRGVFDNARQVLKGEDIEGIGPLEWLNHGPYLLKWLEEPVEVCEVRAAGRAEAPGPPTSSEKAQRQVRADEEPVLGWRPAVGQPVPNTRWLLEKKLGEGGFGEVWLGRNTTTKQASVFKFCFQAERVRFLKRELTLFRLLKERVGSHPHIVAIHDVYLDQPPFYVEMEYVDGKDLRSWCEDQGGVTAVPLETRLEIVAQAAEALQAAHDAGVIHRDVKPGNILIAECGMRSAESDARTPSLRVKLTDFGIGQVVSDEYLKGITRAGFTQTLVGSGASSHTGTQLYMAPELLAGKPASTRSDIYSLGVVLYQLLVGDFTRPVTTDWQRDVTDSLLRGDLTHCFAGNPQDRFAGAGQLAKHLRALPERRAALVQQQAELVKRERAAYRRGMIRSASLAAVIVALVGGLAALALRQSWRASNEAARAEQGEAEARHLLYVANMNVAQQAWDQNNLDRLRQILDETRDSPHRSFEWYFWESKTHSALRTFQGHTWTVASVAFSPDGRRLVTGSGDATAKVWDVGTGKLLRTLRGHGHWVVSVAFSPDGERILTGCNDRTARVWNVATGKPLLTLAGHSAEVYAAFSPDGRRIVTGSPDKTVKLWDAVTGRELLTFDKQGDEGISVAFSPDGKRVVTSGQNPRVVIWEAATGRVLRVIEGHTAPSWCAAFSPDGRRLVTGSRDHTAKVWDLATGTNLRTLRGHSGSVDAVAYSPDGKWILTGSADNTAKIWAAEAEREPYVVKGHGSGIFAVAFSPDGQQFVTGSFDQTAKLWDMASALSADKPGGNKVSLTGHDDRVYSVAISPDGRRIASGSEDRTARVWDVATGHELFKLEGHTNGINSLAYSPDGRRIATIAWGDRTPRIWEAATGRLLLKLEGHTKGTRFAVFSPDGQRLATGGDDKVAKIREVNSGHELSTLRGHEATVTRAAFSHDGRRLVTGSEDSTARVWDTVSGRELLPPLQGGADITSVAFSPDGQWIATAGLDRTGRVWEATSGRLLRTFVGHSDWIVSVAVSPDGRRILTGSHDRTARLWDVSSGRELLTFRGHNDAVTAVAFSPDGRRVVTGSWDKTVAVWEAATPEQVAAWEQEKRTAALEAEHRRMIRARESIKQWLVLAPIPLATNQTGVEAVDLEQVAGESGLKPREGDTVAISGRDLKWRAVALTNEVIDFNAILGKATPRSVAYAVCYLRSETEQRGLRMLVGSDDEAKVYLTGKEVYKSALERAVDVEELDVEADVALTAGLNVVVFKVVNEQAAWQGAMRFTDAQGNPVKGIKVTLHPDAEDRP